MLTAATNPIVAADSKQDVSSVEADPIQKVVEMISKKIRNIEKRRRKLEQYEEDAKQGKKLTDEQQLAVSRKFEAYQQLEFARDMQKAVQLLLEDHRKTMKDEQNRDYHKREQVVIGRIRDLLQYQATLNLLSKEPVKDAFSNGTDGAVKLSAKEIKLCDELFAIICPSLECVTSSQWCEKLNIGAQRAYNLLTGSSKLLVGDSDGRSLKDLLNRITACSYNPAAIGGKITYEIQVPSSKSKLFTDKRSEAINDIQKAAGVTVILATTVTGTVSLRISAFDWTKILHARRLVEAILNSCYDEPQQLNKRFETTSYSGHTGEFDALQGVDASHMVASQALQHMNM